MSTQGQPLRHVVSLASPRLKPDNSGIPFTAPPYGLDWTGFQPSSMPPAVIGACPGGLVFSTPQPSLARALPINANGVSATMMPAPTTCTSG